MSGNEKSGRISDLSFFLIFAGVFGTFNWVRSGPVAGILGVAAIGVVVLIGRSIRARNAK